MRKIRRVGGVAFAGLLLTAVVGGPAASAQTQTKTPETYVGSAAGQALHLKIGTTEVSAGASSASVDSTLKAVADAAGALGLPLVGGTNAGKVEAAAGEVKGSTTPVCATPTFPDPVASVLSIGAACSYSMAAVENSLPKALANGTVFTMDVSANTVLSQLPLDDPNVQTLVNGVLGGLDTINNTLASLPGGAVPDLQTDDTVGELLDALQNTKTLAVKLGDSTSEVITDGNTVTSTATSKAGVIQLLPLGASVVLPDGTIQLKPVVEIEIGSSKATAVYDRATGKSTPSFDPAIVTIRVNTPTTDAISGVTEDLAGISVKEIKVTPDLSVLDPVLGASGEVLVAKCADAPNEFCVLPGTPLETRIAVASGRTVTNPDGSVGAVADAVKVHALRNIDQLPAVGGAVGSSVLAGGILLELAHAQAGVGGRPLELVTIQAPEIPRELPRTGGTPVLPLVAVAGVGLALAARRTIARASR